MDLFSQIPELGIGQIIEVSGENLKIKLNNDINELIKKFNGRNYPIGQNGSIVKIPFGRKTLFAFVSLLKMNPEEPKNIKDIQMIVEDNRIMEAELFAQGEWSQFQKKLEFHRGIETYPLPLQKVYLCLDTELDYIYKGAEQEISKSSISQMIPIGNYVGSSNAICKANVDKLFGHHFAVLGSTGSGKSGTVASILHSILDYEYEKEKEGAKEKKLSPRIILIDPHGEYAKSFGSKALVYRAYNDASATEADGQLIKLPYWLMSGDELRSLIIGKTEFEATSQNNCIYEALTYARQVEAGIAENLGDNPEGQTPIKPVNKKSESDLLNFDRDKPRPFKWSDFETHIDKIQGRKPGQDKKLAPSDKNRQSIDSILKKLKILRTNPQLKFLMEEYSTSSPKLKDVLNQFVAGKSNEGSEEKHIRIIDISGLPNEVAGPLTALISRLLFQYKLWQTKEERRKYPMLFICEEAHRYVPNRGEAQYKEAQDAIRRIAKEGRKYGLGLGLISQRPSDIESTVLSQCNSWIILRLTNSSDQEHVSRFLPDNLKGLTKMLPSLTRREAIFVGEASVLPSRIRIKELSNDKLPDSSDISFIEGWKNQTINEKKLKEIIKRWTKL